MQHHSQLDWAVIISQRLGSWAMSKMSDIGTIEVDGIGRLGVMPDAVLDMARDPLNRMDPTATNDLAKYCAP